MPPKKNAARGRSASRGRGKAAASPAKTPKAKTPAASPSPKKKTPAPKSAKKTPAKKAAATPKVYKMDFNEGDSVMAKWPGTSLYFKAKVTFVRDDDNEYDVQYEDGTIFTIKASQVKATRAVPASATKKTPSRARSRSRGRSPGRKAKPSPARTPKSPKSPVKRASRSSASTRAPRPDPTPTRTSARLAASKVAVSSDDEGRRKAIPNPSHSRKARGFLPDLNLDWLVALFFCTVGPLILVSLHTLAKGNSYKLEYPKLSRNWADYWDREAFFAVFSFGLFIRFLNFLPVGSTVRAINGSEVRLNGFHSLLIVLAAVPALIYRNVDVSFVTKKYFYLMTSALILGLVSATVAYIKANWGKRSNANPKGNTGNFIVDWYNGREFNPYMRGDFKLILYRTCMIGMALINILLVLQNVKENTGKVNPVVIVAAAFQVWYAIDALFFEEYFFFSYDAMNTGYGFSIVSRYISLPFLTTLITKYTIKNSPTLPVPQLVMIAFMNALGYVIFRSSETQRCEFAKNPNQPSLRSLRTLSTVAGRKILAGGWWGLIRHPNILGELLMVWSWVLPAGMS